jgi:hypothetical protein
MHQLRQTTPRKKHEIEAIPTLCRSWRSRWRPHGLGIPEYQAKRYEGKVREGNILISVHTDNRDERARAKEIFERDQDEDVSSASEARSDQQLET